MDESLHLRFQSLRNQAHPKACREVRNGQFLASDFSQPLFRPPRSMVSEFQ